jgi:hypothetical protein
MARKKITKGSDRRAATSLKAAAQPKPESRLGLLRRFVDACKANSLWIVAWSILVAAVSFQGRFLQQVIPTLADFYRQSNRFHSDDNEGDGVLRLIDAIQAGLKASRQISMEYQTTLGGNPLNSTYDPGNTERGLRTIRNSIGELGSSLAVISGTRFHEQLLESFRPGFEGDLRKLDAVAASIEGVYSALAASDKARLRPALQDLKAETNSLQPTLIALKTRFDDFMQEARVLQRGWGIDVAEGVAREKVSSGSEIVFLLAVLYDLAFVLTATRAWRKFGLIKS